MQNLDRLVILDQIGNGAYSKVYKVKDKQTGQLYAAKVSVKSIESDSLQQNGINQREVDILSRFNHPAIIKYIGYSPNNFQNESQPVIITELVSNGSLRNILSSEKEYKNYIGWDDTLKLINIYGIAAAMSFLHSNRIIHRDLKPENILMDNFMCPKIADFGLSKIIHYNQESMTADSDQIAKGTPIYMAPEIWSDSEYSEASDVYSFSLIVYEIITNKRPFKNCSTCYNIMTKVTSGERPDFPIQTPKSYQSLITQCWAQNPSDRPTFDQILIQLKNDPNFITEKVDQKDFKSYIDYLDQYKKQNEQPISIIPINEFINYDSEKFNCIFVIGEPSCIYQQAEKFEKGNGVPIDKQKAVRFYRRAAEKGHVNAMFKYGYMLFYGIGVEIDKTKASQYFKMAADKGQIEAMYYYGWILSQGDANQINQEESCRYYKMAAENGHPDAMNNYAFKLLKGNGIEVDKEKALKYFKDAADKGQIKAMFNYGWMMKYGEGTQVDKKEASIYIKKAADKGYIDAMKCYARMLYNGDGIAIDRTEANRYFQMAAPKRVAKEWFILDSLDDFTISEESFKKPYIKKGIVNSTSQPIIAKFVVNHDIEKLKQECNNLIKCSHPSIQKVIGLYIPKNNDLSALITPFQANSSLNDIWDNLIDVLYDENGIVDENKASYKTIFKILFGVSNAMKYLEDNNMFHGNLTPSNILIDDNFCPILNNIQLSTKYEIEQTKNNIFLAPEIMMGRSSSIKSDVYSFGMLIKQMFTSIEENIGDTSSFKIPDFLNDITAKCLNDDADKRPTFQEIYNHLDKCFVSNMHIQRYKNKIEGELQCPISFYRIPKVIVKSPRQLMRNENDENQDPEESFAINLLELDNLQTLLETVGYDKNVKMVMVCGKYQSGKSTFLRHLTGNGAFYSGKGAVTTTLGILIDGPYYSHDLIDRIQIDSFKPIFPSNQNELQNDPAIFFIDSQGVGDEEFQYYSKIMKRFLSFFCTLSDICINVTDMAESYYIVDEVINTIRRGQTMKLRNEKNDSRQDNNDFNKELTKIIFLVKSVNELNQPINTKKEFDIVQNDFQPIWNSQHRVISNHYLFELSKAVPLGNPYMSYTTYNCSVWNSIPYIFSFLNDSFDNTKDYIQTRVEDAIQFLFTDFYEKFSASSNAVEEQIAFIATAASQIIDSLISQYKKKLIGRQEIIDSIPNIFSIIKRIIIPFTIGKDADISFQDYNQYSYDLMKDITSYLEKNIPKLEKNLFVDMIDMVKSNLNKYVGGGMASISSPVVAATALAVAKEVMVQVGERVALATIPALLSGPAVAIVSAASVVISVGSYFGWFLQKYYSKKKKIDKILKKKVQISIPFLWQKIDDKNNKKIKILSFKDVRRIHTKVDELIIVLESTESNFMKFIIQCMTGVNCKYEDDLNDEKESILYGPFKPNGLMQNISRAYPKFESKIEKDIHILYLRGYTENELKIIEPVQARAMFFLSSIKSIDAYPTILYKMIHLFYFANDNKIALLRKQDCADMQYQIAQSIQDSRHRITPWPILMKDHNCFNDIGPQTNKSLRWAFHQILMRKENQIDIDL